MFELGIRLLAAGTMIAAGLALRVPSGDALIKIGAVLAAYSLFAFQLEKRRLRSKSASAFLAGLDSLAICAALAAIGRLESFGFLSLAPIAYAANRFGVQAISLAPIAAGSVIASHTVFSRAAALPVSLGIQATAILALGLLLNAKVSVIKVPEPVLPTRTDDPETEPPAENLELRESFRRLKENFQHMERNALRDRRRLAIRECRRYEGKRFVEELVKTLLEETGSDGLCLFGLDPFTNRLTPIEWKGAVPPRILEVTISAGTKTPAKKLALELHEAIGDTSALRHAATLLRHKGKVVGALVLTHESVEILGEALEIGEELAPAVAEILVENDDVQTAKRRMREAEMLYDFSTGLSGAKTPSTLASRAVAELADSRQLDSAAIWLIDGDNFSLLAQAGVPSQFFESISFANGPGFAGWTAMGAPDICIGDAFIDSRCGSKFGRDTGAGSLALIPIRFTEAPYAFLAAFTKRIGGIDVETFDILRRTADELAHRVAQFEGHDLEEGLATASEIKAALDSGAEGCLVYLEPQRRAHWADLVGKPAFDSAIREFGRRLKPRLPAGALAVRRPQDDFVVLLRGASVEFATSWANEAAALASFVGLRIPGEDRRLPLGMRAKVAPIGRQMSEISRKEAEVA